MKRIGIMGCGTVAGYGHGPAIRDTEGIELHALYDPDVSNRAAMQERFGVPVATGDLEEFFASGIDAVAITSPAPFHLRNAADAAAHGKHILCEKPLAMTQAEGEEMIRVASEAGVMLFTGLDYRFSPVSQAIYRMVRTGDIGEVRALRLVYLWDLHGKYGNPRRDARMTEGGPMVDCGVHQIDLARWWLGSDVTGFTAHGAWVDEYDAPDHVTLHMDHACGASTMVEISYSYCHTAAEPVSRFTYELIGTEGVIFYDRESRRFECRSSEGTRSLEWAGEKSFAGMYEAFARALAEGTSEVLPTGEDGLIATRIARSATERATAARAVGAVGDFGNRS